MKINIHIGVHKTATTFTQNTLHHNRAKLSAAGIGYMSFWSLRDFLTKDLMEFTPETFRIEDHLTKFFEGQVPGDIHGLVISDENIIGYCGSLLMSGRPFSEARGRLAHLRTLLAGHEITMFCAVRNYGDFLASAYCEGIRNINRYVSFEDFQSRLQWEQMQWPHLLDQFEESLRPRQTMLWRYEDFRANSAYIIDALTFNAGIEMAPPQMKNAAYPSFSKITVETLDIVAKGLGTKIASSLIAPVSQTFPKGKDRPAFEPWTPNEAKMLNQMYLFDCSRIDAGKWLINGTTKAEAAGTDCRVSPAFSNG